RRSGADLERVDQTVAQSEGVRQIDSPTREIALQPRVYDISLGPAGFRPENLGRIRVASGDALTPNTDLIPALVSLVLIDDGGVFRETVQQSWKITLLGGPKVVVDGFRNGFEHASLLPHGGAASDDTADVNRDSWGPGRCGVSSLLSDLPRSSDRGWSL